MKSKFFKTTISAILLIIVILVISSSCRSTESEVPPACSVDEQGFSFTDINGNVHFDDTALRVDLVTGGSQGDYYHIYSLQAPFMDFYSYSINTGDTSTYSPSWNASSGTFFSMNGDPIPYDNNVIFTTETGGSAQGDHIKITFSGQIVDPNSGESQIINGEMCVIIDDVITIPSNCSSVAIEYTLDGITTYHVESVTTAEIFPVGTYQNVGKVYDIWTDEGNGFYYHNSGAGLGTITDWTTDWTNVVGSTLVINGMDVSSGPAFGFEVMREATNIGDLVTIEFGGYFLDASGNPHNISGIICTIIDIVH